MSGKPFVGRAATLISSVVERERILSQRLRRHQVLERPDPAICERDRLGRIRNARRNIRIVEWIVEGVAKKHERAAVMMMRAHKTGAAKSETVPETGPIRPVIRIWIACVIYINPGFGWTTAHITHNFPIG